MVNLRHMVESDLHVVSALLVDAFTQGRVDDGYQRIYVPPCKIEFLQMYFNEAPKGAFVIEENGRLVAASFTHVWGKTGWIGPLAVSSSRHERGLGGQIMVRTVDYLKKAGCTTIGLETNPRSNRNLGFYGKLGFIPTHLTVDLIRDISQWTRSSTEYRLRYFSQGSAAEKRRFLVLVKELTRKATSSVDYSTLILNTELFSFGDTVLLLKEDRPVGFSVLHTQTVSDEEQPNIAKIVVLFLLPQGYADFKKIIREIETILRKDFFEKLLIRVPLTHPRIFQTLLRDGFRVINTDVRMTLEGYGEDVNSRFINLNRWS